MFAWFRRSARLRCLAARVAMGVAITAKWAEAGSDTDRIAAETLFVEGRKLVEEGSVEAGCAKLAESQTLDPAVGTLVNLADCHERLGRLATAWREFREAAALAARKSDARREELAMSRAERIEPR